MSDSVFGDLDGLLQYVDSKFSLVNVVTKRAKQLNGTGNTAPSSNSKRRWPNKSSSCNASGMRRQTGWRHCWRKMSK